MHWFYGTILFLSFTVGATGIWIAIRALDEAREAVLRARLAEYRTETLLDCLHELSDRVRVVARSAGVREPGRADAA